MLKDSFLIHAIGSRDHPKLVEAERASRGLFKAVWWDLVDMLWEQGGYLPMDFDKLAYILRYPTPEEVRRVVMDFGLFENDGERIWNESALDGIRHKREVSASRAASRGRKGTAGQPVENVCSTNDEQMKNVSSTNDEQTLPIKKEREKERKRDISISASDAEKADIYRLFFFKNFMDPGRELQRFLDRYEGNWTRTGSTIPERDHMKLARSWKPEKAAERFKDPDALDWLKRFTATMAGVGIDPDVFLRAIDTCKVGKDYAMTVVMQTAEWRDRVTDAGRGLDEQTVVNLCQPYRALKITCKP